MTDFFASLRTELNIWTQTQARIPAKAFCTQARSATLVMMLARMVTMTRDGNTMPRAAAAPPRSPLFFCPTNTAELMAMMPGVHWLMA